MTRYVLIPRFCSITGYTEKAVRRKMQSGVWLEGRAFGHERINGAWIGPAELAAVLDRLELRERDGGSLSAADFNLLDRFRPGRHDRLQKMGDREFVSW